VSGAARQRLHVERRREGLTVLSVVVDEITVHEVLAAEGFVDPIEPDRQVLADALSKWIFAEMTRHAARLWGAL
jgi:hypothetical protein